MHQFRLRRCIPLPDSFGQTPRLRGASVGRQTPPPRSGGLYLGSPRIPAESGRKCLLDADLFRKAVTFLVPSTTLPLNDTLVSILWGRE